MAKSEKILRKVSDLLTEEFGAQTGELFYTLYQNKDVTEIIKDARSMLSELVGPKVAISKLSEYEKNAR